MGCFDSTQPQLRRRRYRHGGQYRQHDRQQAISDVSPPLPCVNAPHLTPALQHDGPVVQCKGPDLARLRGVCQPLPLGFGVLRNLATRCQQNLHFARHALPHFCRSGYLISPHQIIGCKGAATARFQIYRVRHVCFRHGGQKHRFAQQQTVGHFDGLEARLLRHAGHLLIATPECLRTVSSQHSHREIWRQPCQGRRLLDATQGLPKLLPELPQIEAEKL